MNKMCRLKQGKMVSLHRKAIEDNVRYPTSCLGHVIQTNELAQDYTFLNKISKVDQM